MTLLSTSNLNIEISGKIICQSLNLELNPGEVWGILGANGCGKSTLLHTLANLRAPQHGNVLLHNVPLQKYTAKAIAQYIAILFQQLTNPLTQSVFEFCQLSRFPHQAYFSKLSKHDHAVITDALNIVGLASCQNKLTSELSGGEKRRLSIAALLAQTPHIYLLDEPTNHLDILWQNKIMRHFSMLSMTNNNTIVMSLHDPNHVQQFCTHALLLFPNGKIVQGTVHDVITLENLSSLYQCQLQRIEINNRTAWLTSY